MAKVFNLQRYSLHDGPGIRTTVFFKGCPLTCSWCHNPESQSFETTLMVDEQKCIHCGCCAVAEDIKEACEACPTNAKSLSGKEMSIQEIVNEVLKDRIFYEQSGGGVTLSGGEPLSQGEFLLELVQELKENGLHVTVDTSGFGPSEKLIALLPFVDLFLFDIKLADKEKHQNYVGGPMDLILENLRLLCQNNCNFRIRIPILPGINDSAEELDKIITLLKDLGIKNRIDLLPYHNLSTEKYRRLGLTYELDIPEPSKDHMEEIRSRFISAGFDAGIGG